MCDLSGASLERNQSFPPLFVASVVRKFHLIRKEPIMLRTLFVILLVMWLLGMVSSYTLGGFIHLLLLIALVVLAIDLIEGRRVL